jgi:hypothetical protein
LRAGGRLKERRVRAGHSPSPGAGFGVFNVVSNGVLKAQVRRSESEHTHIELLEYGCVHFSAATRFVEEKVWGQQTIRPDHSGPPSQCEKSECEKSRLDLKKPFGIQMFTPRQFLRFLRR